MKRARIFLGLFALTPASIFLAAEAPNANGQQEQVLALVKEVLTQQTAIAENQTKVDEKLAAVAEAVRVARLYSSRGGR